MSDDIIYLENGIEIIPAWKQCGTIDDTWTEDEKWLWNTGEFTQHTLRISDKEIFVKRHWYVWKNGECGTIVKENDGTYTAHIHILMTRSTIRGFSTLEEAARRLSIGRHTIDKNNPGPLFKTADGKYYDLNNDEVEVRTKS